MRSFNISRREYKGLIREAIVGLRLPRQQQEEVFRAADMMDKVIYGGWVLDDAYCPIAWIERGVPRNSSWGGFVPRFDRLMRERFGGDGGTVIIV